MSFQKKNVFQEFMKEDYVPTSEQFLVKYCSGKGNNLHEVECVDGSTILVSMPKKFRHTIWLKKDDCLVIDPIEEGKKVKGEIVCVLTNDYVRELISSHQWPSKSDTNMAIDTDTLLAFFASSSERNKSNNKDNLDLGAFPPSDSSEDEEEEEDDREDEEDASDVGEIDDCDTDEVSKPDAENGLNNSHSNENVEDIDESQRDRNRSRVQLVTSGVVTVTNVITEGVENDIQSLEFEADEEESSDELSNNSRDLERHANTIRIQVNYNNANTCSGASGD